MTRPRRTRTEDYLTAIEQVRRESGKDRASTGAIARLTGVATGTASSVLRELAAEGLVDLVRYEGATLTPAGLRRVATIQRRLRLIELFLNQSLGVEVADAADEAWLLEPCVSVRLATLIEQRLDHPGIDLFGRPIP